MIWYPAFFVCWLIKTRKAAARSARGSRSLRSLKRPIPPPKKSHYVRFFWLCFQRFDSTRPPDGRHIVPAVDLFYTLSVVLSTTDGVRISPAAGFWLLTYSSPPKYYLQRMAHVVVFWFYSFLFQLPRMPSDALVLTSCWPLDFCA